jgi:hypothetical protein
MNLADSDKVTGAVNQQERLDAQIQLSIQNPQRPYARHRVFAVKIWSDLHGDMQSQTEMFWPLALSAEVTRMSVPIRCSRRKSEEGCP